MTKWKFENRMLDTSYPERIGTDRDGALAAVLSSMAEHSQLEMAVLLRRIGLAGVALGCAGAGATRCAVHWAGVSAVFGQALQREVGVGPGCSVDRSAVAETGQYPLGTFAAVGIPRRRR